MKYLSLHKKAAALVISIVVSCSAVVQAAPVFSDMYIFGDSLSDTGNIADQLGSAFSITVPYGDNNRFSNGPVWHEYLSDSLNMSRETISRNRGNNHAYGGAKVNSGDFFSGFFVDSYQSQVNDYLQNNTVDSGALYISWIGGNDIRSLVGESNTQSAINNALDSISSMLGNLLDSGIKNLLVPNLPDIGAIPEFAGNSADSTQASNLTSAWNAGLAERLDTLYQGHQTANIYHFDVHDLFQQMMNSPASFGFTDVTSQCRSVAGWWGFRYEVECANADSTLFWDEIHPTTAAHSMLAGYAYAMLDQGESIGSGINAVKVSSPSALLFMIFAIGLLGLSRQRV